MRQSINRIQKRKMWIVPSALIITGSLIAMDKDADESIISNYEVWEERNENFINFSKRLDNYLQYTPAAATFVMSICGVKGKNDLPNQAALFIKSEILMGAVVYPVKMLSTEARPDTGKKN